MPHKTVDRVELGELTTDNAISFEGSLEDGRAVRVSVDVFKVHDGFAYGDVLAEEQTGPDSDARTFDPVLSRHLARLPLQGTLEPTRYTLDIAPIDSIHGEHHGLGEEGIATIEWSGLPLAFSRLQLHDRSATPGEDGWEGEPVWGAKELKQLTDSLTPEEIAEDEAWLKELSTEERFRLMSGICDRLFAVGWSYAESDYTAEDTVRISFLIPTHLASRQESVFHKLPIWDGEGKLFTGFALDIGTETGSAVMSYEGPLNARFRQVVDAMVKAALIAEA